MMRWDGFGRSAVFSAVASAAVLPWLALLAPVLGGRRALAAYLVAVTATYLAGIAPSRRRAVGAAALAFLAGGVLLLVVSRPAELAMGLGVVLATVRSAFLFRAPPGRAALVEATLVGGGLCFARFLGGPGALGIVFALWGFFLAQSLYFLAGGVAVRGPLAQHADPFEDACTRAFALLDDDGLR